MVKIKVTSNTFRTLLSQGLLLERNAFTSLMPKQGILSECDLRTLAALEQARL